MTSLRETITAACTLETTVNTSEPNSNGEVELDNWLNRFGNGAVSDNCGSVSTTIVFLSEKRGCGNTFTRFYQFRATDQCGNTNYVTATFSVVDRTPPVIEKCPEGGALTCEFDVPAPNIAGVIASDNCSGSLKVTVNTSSVGVGCKYWPMSVNHWYMVTDECGNMTSCDQSFQIVDLAPPMYAGPDTIDVGCVDDLPRAGELTSFLAPYMIDNCYDIICIGKIVSQNGPNSVTFTVSAKDLCGNRSENFTVTFIATGVCRPLCTAAQSTWANEQASINGTGTTQAIEKFINVHGGITAGKLGKTITATSTICVQSMLPGNGSTAQFNPGNHQFGTVDCQAASPFLNGDGTLKNQVAASVMALQMNIWYNQEFNSRNLGVQRLSTLPGCMLDPAVLAKMNPDLPTVQGLLNLANDYLAGVGFFAQGFGSLLNDALNNLSNHWQNCQVNNVPCPVQGREGARPASGQLLNVSLAPNPVLDLVTLSFEASADAELRVRFVGSTGVQREEFITVVKGENTLNFSTKDFPAGVYTLVLQHDKILQTLRMVKVAN